MLQDRLRLTLGARYQRLKSYAYAAATGAETSRAEDSKVTPMAGVVYRFAPQVSGYINYIEGLTRGDQAPATFGTPGVPVANAGQFLPAYIAKQKEVGVKYDGGKLGASAALFSTNKPFGIVNTATATYVAGGEQRNRGLELAAFGEPVRGIRVLGGMTFLNADNWQPRRRTEWQTSHRRAEAASQCRC